MVLSEEEKQKIVEEEELRKKVKNQGMTPSAKGCLAFILVVVFALIALMNIN